MQDTNDELLAAMDAEDRAGITIRYFEDAHETFPYIYEQSSASARLPGLHLP